MGLIEYDAAHPTLNFGGIRYQPAIRTLLRVDGQDLIRVDPAENNRPPTISALFTDDAGQVVLRLDRNEWIGSTAAWDIETVGRRISVRQAVGEICLILRLDPPGGLTVERMDMRVENVHVIASEHKYAVGIYTDGVTARWIWVDFAVFGAEDGEI